MILLRVSVINPFDSGFLPLILILVSVFVLILFLFALKKRTFPLLNLAFIRILYGRYSFQYVEFFKKNDLRNPLNNCIRDEITLHFSVFFKLLHEAQFFSSATPIEFIDIPFMSSYNRLLKQKGIPHCINIAWFDQARMKVVGYNERFLDVKMKTLFYFLEDNFIMGEYLFSESNQNDKLKITGLLAERYLNGKAITNEAFYISGPNESKLNYHDNGFQISVKYLYTGDPSINTILKSVFTDAFSNGERFKKALIHEDYINRF